MEVRRQQPEWQRDATLKLSQSRTSEALADYHKRGFITIKKNCNLAKEQLVSDIMHARDQSPDVKRLVLAYTRKDVDDLNQRIKVEMVKRGVVSQDNTDITITLRADDEEYQTTQGFAVGDRMLFRENNKELGVMNGSFGTLKAIKGGQLSVMLDNGNIINFSPDEYNRFQLGYAATVHKSQGVTVDETYVLDNAAF